MKKNKSVRKLIIKKAIKAGIEDAKAGRIVTYDKTKDTKVTVEFPICISFFNDTQKPIMIWATPWTHEKNIEVIPPLTAHNIYIQQGFLKLWDRGKYFQLLVE